MRWIILFSAAVLSVFCQRGPGIDYCQSNQFQACTAGLGAFWNKDTSMIWNDITYLSNVITSLLPPPYIIQNEVNVCNGFSNFYACLGQFNIRNCLGTINFIGMGRSPNQAYQYQGMLADWRFKCGVGFFSINENPAVANCTQSTYVNYSTNMDSLFASYFTNVQADPNNACSYAQTLMNGVGNVYATGPCKYIAADRARWYGCQSAREYTNAQFRHCQQITKCAAPPVM